MCVVDVRGLYQWQAARAAAAGAQLALREHVTGVVQDAAGAVLGVAVRGRGEVRARLVIDATGTAGVVARAAGLRGSAPRTAVGLEVEVLAPGWDQREALLVVGDEVAPGGYGWAFPRGDGRLRIGVGVVRPDSTADVEALLAGLVDRVPALRATCAGAQPLETHSGVMPAFAHAAVPAAAAGLLVVGDAAGHGSTLLGEGIRHALVSGRLAGRTAALALAQEGVATGVALQPFAREWDRLVGRQMRLGWALHQRVCRYTDTEWMAVLDAVAPLSPRLVMTALAGELTPGFAVRLLLRHPVAASGQARRFMRAALSRP